MAFLNYDGSVRVRHAIRPETIYKDKKKHIRISAKFIHTIEGNGLMPKDDFGSDEFCGTKIVKVVAA